MSIYFIPELNILVESDAFNEKVAWWVQYDYSKEYKAFYVGEL